MIASCGFNYDTNCGIGTSYNNNLVSYNVK